MEHFHALKYEYYTTPSIEHFHAFKKNYRYVSISTLKYREKKGYICFDININIKISREKKVTCKVC